MISNTPFDGSLKDFIGLPCITEAGLIRHETSRKLSFHRNRGYEICFSYSGVFTWENRDGRRLRIRGNQISLTPPDWEHRGEFDRMNPGHLLFLVFDPDRARSVLPDEEELSYLKRELAARAGQVCRADRATINTALLLESLWTQAARASDSVRKSLRYSLRKGILLFVHQTLTSYSGEEEQNIPAQLKDLTDYIEGNLSEPIRLNDLAVHSGLGKTHIHELFRTYAGQSPNEYILYIKCEEAKNQLWETTRPITAIAFDLGFSSSQYFSQVFRKFTGYTPGEFRKRSKPADRR